MADGSRRVAFREVAEPGRRGGCLVVVADALRGVEVVIDLIASNDGDCRRRGLIRCTYAPRRDPISASPCVQPVVYAEVPGGEEARSDSSSWDLRTASHLRYRFIEHLS